MLRKIINVTYKVKASNIAINYTTSLIAYSLMRLWGDTY